MRYWIVVVVGLLMSGIVQAAIPVFDKAAQKMDLPAFQAAMAQAQVMEGDDVLLAKVGQQLHGEFAPSLSAKAARDKNSLADAFVAAHGERMSIGRFWSLAKREEIVVPDAVLIKKVAQDDKPVATSAPVTAASAPRAEPLPPAADQPPATAPLPPRAPTLVTVGSGDPSVAITAALEALKAKSKAQEVEMSKLIQKMRNTASARDLTDLKTKLGDIQTAQQATAKQQEAIIMGAAASAASAATAPALAQVKEAVGAINKLLESLDGPEGLTEKVKRATELAKEAKNAPTSWWVWVGLASALALAGLGLFLGWRNSLVAADAKEVADKAMAANEQAHERANAAANSVARAEEAASNAASAANEVRAVRTFVENQIGFGKLDQDLLGAIERLTLGKVNQTASGTITVQETEGPATYRITLTVVSSDHRRGNMLKVEGVADRTEPVKARTVRSIILRACNLGNGKHCFTERVEIGTLTEQAAASAAASATTMSGDVGVPNLDFRAVNQAAAQVGGESDDLVPVITTNVAVATPAAPIGGLGFELTQPGEEGPVAKAQGQAAAPAVPDASPGGDGGVVQEEQVLDGAHDKAADFARRTGAASVVVAGGLRKCK